ncbi:MAG: hypothetical protein NVV73_03350 [Cellvibrionaceae bacterium]|nr:hypothetical protein [Cellvibrionaceae bacterium]
MASSAAGLTGARPVSKSTIAAAGTWEAPGQVVDCPFDQRAPGAALCWQHFHGLSHVVTRNRSNRQAVPQRTDKGTRASKCGRAWTIVGSLFLRLTASGALPTFARNFQAASARRGSA